MLEKGVAVICKKIFFYLIISLILFINNSVAKNIPIIVVSPGKTIQSQGVVGSDVSVITTKEIGESNNLFLGDAISNNLNGINYWQAGGVGTVSGIQLRGLPKRYSTIFIDGVKMSDPASPTNDYYFSNLMTSSIDRVEVLKGAQNTLYGSGAIGGTVNIFTKRGREGHNRNIDVITGSNLTKNINLSFDGKENNYDYFVGISKFLTDGISAMDDNKGESDKYYNDNLTANFGYQFSDKVRVENYLRYADTFLEYDEPTAGRPDNNETDDQEGTYSLKIIFDNNNFKNNLSYNKTYIKRVTTNYNHTSTDHYWGQRDSLNLLGEYNFDNDTKLVYGLDNEFDRVDFTTWAVTGNKMSDESIFSQYFDLQLRPTKKIYSTIGFRNDHQTTAGSYQTGRLTLAYKLDGNTKLRSSMGTGIRFPSLNDYYYDTVVDTKEDLKPEKSASIDVGVDKYFNKYNLNTNLTIFYTRYEDNISNWASHTDGGKGDTYTIMNSDGITRSSGIEFSSLWKLKNDINFNFDYSHIDAHEGETCDDPNYADFMDISKCNDDMPVRVPRNSFKAKINKNFSNNLNSSLSFNYFGKTRDYGNANNNYNDVMLGDYYKVDFTSNYKLFDNYNLYFSARNLTDEGYSQSYQYTTLGRNFDFGLKRAF